MRCPICTFHDDDADVLTLHVEETHFSDSSVTNTFATQEDSYPLFDLDSALAQQLQQEEIGRKADEDQPTHSDDDDEYLPCPEGCGEHVLWNELQVHLDLHLAENLQPDDSEDSFFQDMYAPYPYQQSSSYSRYIPQYLHYPPFPYQCGPYNRYTHHNHAVTPAYLHAYYLATTTRWPRDSIAAWLSSQELPYIDELTVQHNVREPRLAHHYQYSNSSANATAFSESARSSLGRKNVNDRRNVASAKRLGKRELGPYAYEDHMPAALQEMLRQGAERRRVQRISPTGQLYSSITYANEVHGIVTALAKLLDQDTNVSRAWLCDHRVQHVFKMSGEGGFCGYRNCQMMLSYILNTKWPGSHHVTRVMGVDHTDPEPGIPGVLMLQDLIEEAWDRGYNTRCRVETGGVRRTRKYIGTPEAEALLESLNIATRFEQCHDKSFRDERDPRNRLAYEELLDCVEMYFRTGALPRGGAENQAPTAESHIVMTAQPPIYLQQPGHSLTIVGYEKGKDGSRNILVLDPGYKTSEGVKRELDKLEHHQSSSVPSSSRYTSPAANNTTLRSVANTRKGPVHTTDGRIDGWVRRSRAESGSGASAYSSGSPSAADSRGYRSDRSSQNAERPSLRAGLSNMVNAAFAPAPLKAKQPDPNQRRSQQAARLLTAYRRGKKHLARHREFEMLMLKDPRDDQQLRQNLDPTRPDFVYGDPRGHGHE